MDLQQAPPSRRWATINETARYLRCSRNTIHRRIKSGSIKAYREGGRVLIDLDELDTGLSTGTSSTLGDIEAHGLTWGSLRAIVNCGTHYQDEDLVHPGSFRTGR